MYLWLDRIPPHQGTKAYLWVRSHRLHTPYRFLSGWLQHKEQHKARCFGGGKKGEFPPKIAMDTRPPIDSRDDSRANHIIPRWGAKARNMDLFCRITAYCQNPPKVFSLSKNPRDNGVKTSVHKYLCE